MECIEERNITMTRKFDSIDLLKFVFCIFIVSLHSNALYDISPFFNMLICEGIGRLGVPFFFTASAFFLFIKPVTWEGFKKYCKRLLTLYVAWFIISIPKTVFDRFICSRYPFPLTLFRFIRSFFVTSTFSGSWFITSCIFCALLYYALEMLDDQKRKRLTLTLSIIVYCWISFTSAYGNLMKPLGMTGFYEGYEMIFANPYCSIIVGIPYFALGRYFAKNVDEDNEVNGSLCGIHFIISLMILLAEVYLTNTYKLAKSTDCYLMLLPCIYFLFRLVTRWGVKLRNARLLRIASTIIFFSQFWLLFLCEFAEWSLSIVIPWLVKFVFSIISGSLLTLLILQLQDKKGFEWLRYLY